MGAFTRKSKADRGLDLCLCGGHYSHRQTQPAKSGGLGGRVGCGGRLTRMVGTVIFGGRGGRSILGFWVHGMAVPPWGDD